MGFCQQVFPPLASLGAVLIIYIPQLGLRPRSFIYIIRIGEILYIEKVCFFSTVYIGPGGTVKKRHKFSLPRKYKLAAARVFIFFSLRVEKVISSVLFSYLIFERKCLDFSFSLCYNKEKQE